MTNNYIKTFMELNNEFIDSVIEDIFIDKEAILLICNVDIDDNKKTSFIRYLLKSITEILYMIKILEMRSMITSRNNIFNESEKNMIVIYAYLMDKIAIKLKEIKAVLLLSPIDYKKAIDLLDQVIDLLYKNKELMIL